MGRMHAGCTFADMDAHRVVTVDPGCKASFKDCAFESNTLYNATDGAAVVRISLPQKNGGESTQSQVRWYPQIEQFWIFWL